MNAVKEKEQEQKNKCSSINLCLSEPWADGSFLSQFTHRWRAEILYMVKVKEVHTLQQFMVSVFVTLMCDKCSLISD